MKLSIAMVFVAISAGVSTSAFAQKDGNYYLTPPNGGAGTRCLSTMGARAMAVRHMGHIIVAAGKLMGQLLLNRFMFNTKYWAVKIVTNSNKLAPPKRRKY